MSNDELKQSVERLINRAVGLQSLASLSDEALAFIVDAKEFPTQEKLAILEKHCQEFQDFLNQRVVNYRNRLNQPAETAPEQFAVQNSFIN